MLGDKDLTTNLRYKQGRNMKYNNKEVFEIDNPKDVFLPSVNISSKYIFAREDYFFYTLITSIIMLIITKKLFSMGEYHLKK